MNREEAQRWAREWIDAWNRRDLSSILVHYRDDVVMRSPTAEIFAGSPVVRGREALTAYWNKALSSTRSLSFTLEQVVWDAERQAMVIIFEQKINDRTRYASELFVFDEQQRVWETSAYHGGAKPPAATSAQKSE